jgi:hypothetical protein
MFCSYMGTYPARESGKQVLAGLAPFGQTIESLWIIPFPTKPEGKNWQKVIRQIYFNGKMHTATFDQTKLAFL